MHSKMVHKSNARSQKHTSKKKITHIHISICICKCKNQLQESPQPKENPTNFKLPRKGTILRGREIKNVTGKKMRRLPKTKKKGFFFFFCKCCESEGWDMPLDLTDAVGWTEKLLKLKSNFSCFVHCIESRN